MLCDTLLTRSIYPALLAQFMKSIVRLTTTPKIEQKSFWKRILQWKYGPVPAGLPGWCARALTDRFNEGELLPDAEDWTLGLSGTSGNAQG